ncbi:MAG: glycosyltransferase [Fervidobacterium sp.]|uniref:glycosyltransferase n=1 Tax=Fervidobacterium sp. TaxID=1871331 RepID=UPI0025BD9971|nr:glycosyltransferase [Fervidobacterium sp.]NPU89973.1 glycosyltransferase [Fervidobacterium sp.]
MIFHILGLAHIPTRKEYSCCAYTQKIYKLCKMLKSLGHTVYFYGVETSDVECDENITVLDINVLEKVYGKYNYNVQFFKHDPNDEAYMTFNTNAIKAINERKSNADFILVTMGNYQKPITDAVRLDMAVESGIGYEGIYLNKRVFESYAWMHYVYGLIKQSDGVWFDCVIPNYYDPNDFVYSDKKENYALYMGRIINRKGVYVAAESTKYVGIPLYVVGQGSIKSNELDLSVYKHITYLPAVGVERRAELMSKAIAVFTPTYYIEPFGGVAVEAQMCGTPVISTDWGAFSETVLHGKTGYRCRTLEQFIWAIKNIDKINPIDCRNWATENYNLDKCARMYDEYFNMLNTLWYNGWYEMRQRDNLAWLSKSYP